MPSHYEQIYNVPEVPMGGGLQPSINVPEQPGMNLKAVENFKASQAQRGVGIGDFKGTVTGAMTGNPALAATGLGIDLLGLGVSAYGQYKSREAAEEAADRAEERYQDALLRMEELDAERRDQQRRANEMAYGEYAMGLEDQAVKLGGIYM